MFEKSLLTGKFLFFALLLLVSSANLPKALAQDSTPPSELPRLTLAGFDYQGAFRLPAETFGISDMNYSEGPLEYSASRNSIFIVGHAHQQALVEFRVPTLVNSSRLTDLNMAASPLQSFASLFDRVPGGNAQNLNRIGGMEYVEGSGGAELIVNAYEYYDAPGDNTLTTLVVRSPHDLANSSVEGFYQFQGGAGHTSGWISPVPTVWQSSLGGTHITGQSSGMPIISRLSVGPSAFAFDPASIAGNSSVPTPVPTSMLLDYSLENPLHSDLYNSSGANNLWTHLSRAVYGFVVPGSRTYASIGHSGGHNSGVCYKCTQNDGHLCGGYCPPDASDYSHYYWLFDVNDLVAVKNGSMNSYDVRPYEYGVMTTPFETRELGGASFDPASGLLYVTVQRADDEQGEYSNPPVVVVYKFSADSGADTAPAAPTNLRFR